jgi:hypothetical protein
MNAEPLHFQLGWSSGNDKSLVLVNPETIVRWHRAGFRLVLEFDLQGETASRKEEAV